MRRAVPQVVVVAVGVWLMAAPAVLGYAGTTAGSSDRFVGPLTAAIAFVAASAITRPLRWSNVATGAYLLAAPWLLGFPAPARVNDLLAGVVILALTPLGSIDPARFGGGWWSIVKTERLARRG